MSVRKEDMKRQFTMQAGVLEPGEQVVTGMLVQTGASPWVAGIIGIVLMLLGGTRVYYLALTDRRVLFLKAGMITMKPKGEVTWADPRGAVSISDVERDARIWNWLRYHRPGVAEPVRVNVNAVRWNPEFQTLVENLERDAVPTTPGTPPMPPPPAGP